MKSLAYYRDALAPHRFFGSKAGPRQVPVFMYHHADPRGFDRHLRFLADNGYRAEACDRVEWSNPNPRTVVLTFDDGRRSVWSVAAPLLKKYGFRATAFVSPGMIGEGDPSPTIESGAVHDLEARHYGNHELFNWAEAESLARGGSVDLQLHGFAHARVFVSSRLVGFHHPERRDRNLGIAGWIVRRGGADEVTTELPLGQPLYEWGSRWGASPRYLEDENVTAACLDLVRRRGGRDFFNSPGWHAELEAVWRVAARGESASEEYEAAREKRARLEGLLKRARDLLEERTGVVAEHFALPWAEGNEVVSAVADAAAMRHVYWGASIPTDALNNPCGIVHHHRLKDQSVVRLPGRGRQSLPVTLAVVARSYLDR